MIDWLLMMVLGPWVPGMEDPATVYKPEMVALTARIERSMALQNEPPAAIDYRPPTPISHPVITGRLFEFRELIAPADQTQMSADAIGALSLSGILQSGRDRVAIVSDGENDHVVAAGSHLFQSARVLRVNQDSVVLSIDAKEGKGKLVELRLGMMPAKENKQ